MKKILTICGLGLIASSISYADVAPYSDIQNPMGVPKPDNQRAPTPDQQRMEEDQRNFPEDEFYTPEEMTPEEQEEQRMIQDENEWELGEPLPQDEEVPFSPNEEYDSF